MLYNVKETSEILKVSRETMYKLINENKIKYINMGSRSRRCIRFTLDDIQNFIEDHRAVAE